MVNVLIDCHVYLQLLLKAGGDSRQTVFLFSDSQIKDESFMEDISMILNTGDVPNLYGSEEKAEIIEKMQNIARNEVSIRNPSGLQRDAIESCDQNLLIYGATVL